jgi:sulfur-oxidizing protein SoxX
MRRAEAWALGAALAAAVVAASAQPASAVGARTAPAGVVGDAMPEPLTATPGDAARGRAIVASRQVGLCLLCHTGPFPEEHFQGNLAPDLAGAGARWSTAQLRLRIVDSRRVNPETIMPAYHRVDGLVRVGRAWAGKPVLDAQQVEDVVAFLATLREPGPSR